MAVKYSKDWWAEQRPEVIGKETEKLVEQVFTKWNRYSCWASHRLPDAKSARGRVKAQPADTMYRCGDKAGFIEIKALKHSHRLPAERVTQHATLAKWTLAGSSDLVLVHHYLEPGWRVVKVADLPFGIPSWNLQHLPMFESAEAALLSTGFFEGMINAERR